MSDVTGHLLALQDLDTSITQLQHRRDVLAQASGLAEAETRLRSMSDEEADASERRRALAARQKELEEQIGGISERRDAIEQRMYAATSSSGRDLQAMSEEVRHLTDRRSELEEQELVAMLEQDSIDAEIQALRDRREPVEQQVGELRAQVEAQQREIDTELDTATGARAHEAALVPTALADRYETLRTRLKGTGAARLIGNRCDGCHLELSSVEVEKIRGLAPDEIATCEQCGRILVPV
jgi:uncharacterized protein